MFLRFPEALFQKVDLFPVKQCKQEKPEMDDFEEEKTLVLKEKYFEKFNILRKYFEKFLTF